MLFPQIFFRNALFGASPARMETSLLIFVIYFSLMEGGETYTFLTCILCYMETYHF